ncbi:glycoside hydrolase family 15 protein [Streptomyces sp. TRM 70361]|uniref:glycoside hydrolase family 15 protein n=1 Tax=Streptomyces sp. TRM 70361 TaxID=3116553 RepID=UPI002E7B13B4|nr:glycoside hydrolase family 15 protein [Streptomyces sp. TRM 70361]MEE1938316.1 glycoside hydrolase family 15 protein [Streptomyces sp. TRM 70361]
MVNTPIEDYALLSDRHSAALVSRSGMVDWLCFPRFDSPSVLAALLDDQAGTWCLRPTHEGPVSRHYLDDTLVLCTEFSTPTGTVAVTDALSTGRCDNPHRLGSGSPHLLVRSVTCTEGTAEVTTDFRPRPEYGRVVPLLSECDGGMIARGGPSVLALSSPVPLILDEHSDAAHGTAHLRAGETLRFGLHWGPMTGPAPRVWSQDELAEQLECTVDAWRDWSREHQDYRGEWEKEINLSGRILQGLGYQPSGAIVAAPTTSLPEEVGGERNWDYRYAWVRDAAFTMDALWVAGCPDEAEEFLKFMTDAAATGWTRSHLQIMYGIGGEHDLTERRLDHLEGWRGSRPVRVGNGAWDQPQTDVYGEFLDTAYRYAHEFDDAGPELRDFAVSLADAAAELWDVPDHGLWEMRGEPRHFLYSKLMCWVALDRALKLSDRLGSAARIDTWRQVREEIRAAILTRGWSEEAGAYTQAFGYPELDASSLQLAITGFLPADDPRMLATIDAIGERLTDERGMVYRYHTTTGVDGLSGDEGTFLLCTFWLAQTQALAGRTGQARETFARAASHANDLGLLAEEADPHTGRMLGNFPQAFSHIGLVNAAWTIVRAEQGVRGADPALSPVPDHRHVPA